MKIAVIGTGISGLTAAYLLHKDHDLTVYESNDYVGGHTHTVDVDLAEGRFAVDTGFIVFNEVTYPNFCKLLHRLGVASQPGPMTFSVKCEKTGLEYSPHNPNTLFAQRRNLIWPPFWKMLLDIARFRRRLDRLIEDPDQEKPLVEVLREQKFSAGFIDWFITPLGSSLWSADPQRFKDFPLATFVRFFKNHGFLEIRNPFAWRVIKGGSQRYVEKLTAGFADRIRTNCPVKRIRRFADRVEVTDGSGATSSYDQIILAVHSDQALALLEDPSAAEKEVLGAIAYQPNDTVLHTDTRLLPQRRWIWASWNYLIPRQDQDRSCLTYDMNILQSLTASAEFCVTLNAPHPIDPGQVKARFVYHHPVFTTRSPAAQNRHAQISGVNRTHFCGAYWGYGFHEDGVNSALAACRYFGKGL